MYTLTSNIIIERALEGDTITFSSVNDVNIQKSIHSNTDTATIKLPTSARLERSANAKANLLSSLTVSTETAVNFSQGDKVTIQLGYNGQLMTEFVGFIKTVGFGTPCEIDCEGYIWQLRHTAKFTLSWDSISLRELLQTITAGTDIKLDPNISNLTFQCFNINEKTGAEVLASLQKDYQLTIYFMENVLYACLADKYQLSSAATYKIGWNTISSDQLKFTKADEVNTKINLTYKDATGKQLQMVNTYGKGPQAIQKSYALKVDTVFDIATLTAISEKYALSMAYPGYQGKLTAFLIPYAQPGWTANVVDDKYPERNGTYLLESIEVQFGVKGARRIAGIGKAL